MKAIMIASLILASVALAGITVAQEKFYGDNARAQSRAQAVYDSLMELGVQEVLVFYQDSPRMRIHADERLGEGLCTSVQRGRDFASALLDLMEYDMPGLESYEVQVWYNEELALRAQKQLGLVSVEFLE